jgi:peptide/nickel transport system substrate-binding protein
LDGDPPSDPLRRRVRRRGVLRGGALGLAGLALAGCTSEATAPTPPAATAAATRVAAPTTGAQPAPSPAATARPAKLGGTLRLSNGLTDAPHLDPHQTNSALLITFGAAQAWGQLAQYKNGPDVAMPTFEVVGDLAESWTQPDDLTYVFKLRPTVKYHNLPPVNGREVEAEDVVQSFKRQVAMKTNASFLQGLKTIEAVDKATVKITVEQPNADFLASVASNFCKVIPRETFASGDLKAGPVVGTGPFLFGSWEMGKTLELLRSPDYYQKGKPYLDKIQWFRLADSATLLSAFRSNNLDLLRFGFTKGDTDTLKKERPELVVTTSKGGQRLEYGLKGDRPPFNDIRVRQAFFKAINRQEVIDTLLDGVGHIDPGITLGSPAQELPADELKRLYAYDPDGAKQLLQQAGVSGLDVEVQVSNTLSGLVVQIGELLQAQLKKVNINVKLNPLATAAYVEQVTAGGNYAAFLGVQGVQAQTSTELLNRHHSKGPQFTSGVADPELDRMIEQQATLVKDPAGRAKLIQDIQRKIIGLYAINMVAVQDSLRIAWPTVKDFNPNGVVNNSLGDYLWVWLDK